LFSEKKLHDKQGGVDDLTSILQGKNRGGGVLHSVSVEDADKWRERVLPLFS